MTAIVLLFIVGVLLLAFEVIVPGGILGVLGVLAMIAGCGMAFADFGVSGGSLAVVSALILVGLVLYLEFIVLPKTKWGQRLFLKKAVTGTASQDRAASLNGAVGKTVTALAPTGYVLIDGQRHEAFSRSGFLENDAPVKVVGMDNFRLIVTLEK